MDIEEIDLFNPLGILADFRFKNRQFEFFLPEKVSRTRCLNLKK